MVVAAGAASMLAALALLSACGNSSSSKEVIQAIKILQLQQFVGLIGGMIILNFQIS